jgi:hypothetical protein
MSTRYFLEEMPDPAAPGSPLSPLSPFAFTPVFYPFIYQYPSVPIDIVGATPSFPLSPFITFGSQLVMSGSI